MFCYLIPTHNKQLGESFVGNVPVAANLMTVSLVTGTAAPLGYLCTASSRVLYSGINISAIPANNLGIKWIYLATLCIGICEMVLTVLAPSFKLCLNCFPCFNINDWFVVSFNMILWKGPVIHDTPFGKKICCIAFLKNSITHILLISKHRIKRTRLPIVFSIPVFYLLSFKYPGNIINHFPGHEFLINPNHYLSLLPVYNKVPFLIRIIP